MFLGKENRASSSTRTSFYFIDKTKREEKQLFLLLLGYSKKIWYA
ncbi:hypothetical protein NEOC65_001297 [Neochlamydia sp. AcF65]|nr:hypothetical protein [Neochlamydia sp. AcF65]MBS4170353.1 hypothetical protein [Neochlamydia sp. AcF95]